MSTLPSIDVAIVNWNTTEAARACGAAYAASEGVEAHVVIADNDSLPSQQAGLRVPPPGLSVRFNEANDGYGTAVNAVLESGDAEFVCASNADIIPEPEMLRRLIDVCSDPGIGLAGPVLEPEARGYHARLPTSAALLIRPFAGSFGHHTVASPGPSEVREIEQPAGACLVSGRRNWELLGGFDPEYFLFYEDVDLARRSLDAGLRNVVVGGATAHHTGAHAIAGLDPREHQRQRLLSLRRYVDKHHPGVARPARPLISAALWIRARQR